jgi:hypothetical protein
MTQILELVVFKNTIVLKENRESIKKNVEEFKQISGVIKN